jgi:hypothetical protein
LARIGQLEILEKLELAIPAELDAAESALFSAATRLPLLKSLVIVRDIHVTEQNVFRRRSARGVLDLIESSGLEVLGLVDSDLDGGLKRVFEANPIKSLKLENVGLDVGLPCDIFT